MAYSAKAPLPPLNALKAFEVAARHLNLTKAAAELFVTPAAVSRHIKVLEEYLDVTLFIRGNQGLELTEVALHCYWKPQGIEFVCNTQSNRCTYILVRLYTFLTRLGT